MTGAGRCDRRGEVKESLSRRGLLELALRWTRPAAALCGKIASYARRAGPLSDNVRRCILSFTIHLC